jgi:hypothetical protein
MKLVHDISNILIKIWKNSDEFSETWNSITISGSGDNLKDDFILFFKFFSDLNISNDHYLFINDNEIDIDGLVRNVNIVSWELEFNKKLFIQHLDVEFLPLFFIDKNQFIDFVKKWNYFQKDYFINQHTKLVFLVNDYDNEFFGPNIHVSSLFNCPTSFFSENDYTFIPDKNTLKKFVKIISINDSILDPAKFIITNFWKTTDSITDCFSIISANNLSVCLVDEFYSKDKCILDGVRRLEVSLDKYWDAPVISDILKGLNESINWIFSEKVETRKKLFIDRLSLDKEQDDSFIVTISKNLDSVFSQAKEHYNFVIIDRKDAYINELKGLLSDLKTQSELYSTKLRQLLSNLLRDMLAALLLLGFTILSKFQNNQDLLEDDIVKYLFKVIAIYYILSYVLQSILNFTDISSSKKELLYWKNVTRNFISRKEFDNHINQTLKYRISGFTFVYVLISILYILISYFAWNYSSWLKFVTDLK